MVNTRRRRTLRCGSRSSALAMVQTHHVRSLVGKEVPVAIQVGVESIGDQLLNESLASLAAKTPGLFTTELEGGLIVKQYDFVVHSLKDMPTTLPEGLVLAAITEREDPRDALVLNAKHKGRNGLGGLPSGSVVGTSSVRREAIIKRDFPTLLVKMVRGNVGTRLGKLDNGEYDALILAAAGLTRLDMSDRIASYLDPSTFMYGVGQGALGLECRAEDVETINILQRTANHRPSQLRCEAERSLLRALQGGCQVPLGVHSSVSSSGEIHLRCTVMSPDGSQSIEESHSGTDSVKVGYELSLKLRKRGADKFMTGGEARPLTYGKP